MIITNILETSKYIIVNALDMTIFLSRKIDASLKIITGTICCCFCCNKNLYEDYYTKQIEIILHNRPAYELIKNNDDNDNSNTSTTNIKNTTTNTTENKNNEDILDSYNVLNDNYIKDRTLNINLPTNTFKKSEYY